MKGYMHSIESMGTLDGPGIRTVVFFQGCPLKCKFCHNIDTNFPRQGQEYTTQELLKTVLKNKEYWGKNGGVTISGGEPVMQPEFLLEFVKLLKENNIHVAIDTCLETTKKVLDSLMPFTDLWMVSLKELDNKKHIELTSSENTNILENIKYLDKKSKAKIRIRFLVIPTITDNDGLVMKVGEFVKNVKKLEALELLAYGTHGKDKWYEFFDEYHLEDVRDANPEDLENIRKKLEGFNFEIIF